MIKDFDRGHFFGASDAKHIFSEDHTKKSWLDFWEVKKGGENTFHGNIYTRAGNMYEHSILKAFDENIEFDKQIIIPSLRLRANLDGNTNDGIFECKTHKIENPFVITEAYMQQAQLQMYAWNNEEMSPVPVQCDGRPPWAKKNKPVDHVTFVHYGLMQDEYNEDYPIDRIESGTLPVDPTRVKDDVCKISRSYQRRIPRILRKLARRLEKEEYRRLEGDPFEKA